MSAHPVFSHTVGNDLAEISGAITWADALASEAGLSADVKFAIEICLEETLSNLIVHGKARAPGAKDIAVSFAADGGSAVLIVSDRCIPFDITREAPPIAPTAEDMLEGGQGLRLLGAFATSLAYESADDRNHLTITVRPADSAGDEAPA